MEFGLGIEESSNQIPNERVVIGYENTVGQWVGDASQLTSSVRYRTKLHERSIYGDHCIWLRAPTQACELKFRRQVLREHSGRGDGV